MAIPKAAHSPRSDAANDRLGLSVALGVTQIIGFGTLMYGYAVLLPSMAQELNLSLSRTFAILSGALFLGGLIAPLSGAAIDRFGGRVILSLGSAVAALALLAMSQVSGPWGLFGAVVIAEFAAMAVLYDAAFAAIARICHGHAARRVITQITLIGGFASTVFWPLALWLTQTIGWSETWMVFACLHLGICLPIHWCVLQRRAGPTAVAVKSATDPAPWPEVSGRERRRAMVWMMISFTLSGYVFGGMMVLWVANFEALGVAPAAAAFAGALIGPAKVAGRVAEMVFAGKRHPILTAYVSLVVILFAFAVLFAFGASAWNAALFAVLFGAGDGLRAIIRGTLPLALFGHKNYGARLGWVSFVRMAANATAPAVFAWIMETVSPWAAFGTMAAVTASALLTLSFIPIPQSQE